MVDFPLDTHLSHIQVATVRLNMLGGIGNFAKLALCDEEMRPMSMTMLQTFSPRTLELIDALRESIEQDAHDVFAKRAAERADDGTDNEGVSYG